MANSQTDRLSSSSANMYVLEALLINFKHFYTTERFVATVWVLIMKFEAKVSQEKIGI